VFFVDILRGDDEAARNALRHLGEIAEFVKVLGIYWSSPRIRKTTPPAEKSSRR
jgi:prephenate dehydratase